MTEWKIDSTNLRTLGYNIETTDSWEGIPASRLERLEYPYRNGVILSGEQFYMEREMSLAMVVNDCATDGTRTLTSAEHVQQNLDTLLGLFYGQRTLTKTVGTVDRAATVRVLDAFDVREGLKANRLFVARFVLPYPFWHKLPAPSPVAGTGSLVLTNNGNAPIQDAVITFTTSGRLTHSASGDYVESAVSGLILDLGAWSIKLSGNNADKQLTFNKPHLFFFRPGANNLVATGTVSIAFYHTYFS